MSTRPEPAGAAPQVRYAFPLSHAQQRMWFLEQLEPDGGTYNLPALYRLRGALQIGALERALELLIERHEALRTVFPVRDGQPVQLVTPGLRSRLTVECLATSDRARDWETIAAQEAARPFDLERGPLLRVRLLRLGPQEHMLVLVIHHIVADGWSMAILCRELSALYDGVCGQAVPSLPSLSITYADYAVWQRGGQGDAGLETWRSRLADAPARLNLPTDWPRPLVQSRRGARLVTELPGALRGRLGGLARRFACTPHMVLLAAFGVLLHRHSGEEDMVVGIPVAGRRRTELEGLVGLFVNTLPLRLRIAPEATFEALLRRVRQAALDAYAVQDVPFEKLVEALRPPRDPGHSPIFQVMFSLQNTPGPVLAFDGIEIEPLSVHTGTAKFDLTVTISERGGGLEAAFQYRTDLFAPSTIERMAGHYRRLLEGIVEDPSGCVARLPMIGEAEQRRLRAWGEPTPRHVPEATVHGRFEEQVRRTPNAAAVSSDEMRLSYRELDARADRVAARLAALGVERHTRVGLCLERSADLVVGMLGILKAGGAYVPLDPEYPVARLDLMQAVGGVEVVVTTRALHRSLLSGASAVCLDEADDATGSAEPSSGYADSDPGDLAYVMFTSGSTGEPKGVMITHRAVVRLVVGTDYVSLGPTDVVAQASSCAFDAATFEVWGALLNGARLHVLTKGLTLSPRAFGEALAHAGVTTLFLTTALFNTLAEVAPCCLARLRNLLFGGEAADPRWVRRVLEVAPPARLVHVYGPTETTTFATWDEVVAVDANAVSIPIGRPVATTTVRVLSAALEPAPIGVPGELFIGGDGLARGYQGRPALTAERFVADPWGRDPQSRLFRTGDVVRYRADGRLEFLGRRDDQIKVRGHRIELGEIEHALGRHPDVSRSLAALRVDERGEKRIVAYVVPEDETVDTQGLYRHLGALLPEFMLPDAIVPLAALPMSVNGKVDREALPAAGSWRRSPTTEHAAPRSRAEQQIAELFGELLGAGEVGRYDDFFELGGHSLLAAKLVALIEDRLEVNIHLNALWFEGARVADLAALTERTSGTAATADDVIVMRGGGAQPPLFCIHTIGAGNLFHYEPLVAHLRADRPVYGLEPRGLHGGSPQRTVEDMARHCVVGLRRRQAHGPYHLCGFSSGGVVALEIAQQLLAEGESIGLLAAVDTFFGNPGGPRGLLRWAVKAARNQQWRALQEQAYWVALRAAGLAQRRRLRTLGEAHRWAFWSYRPKPFHGSVLLFEAAESAARSNAPNRAWAHIAHGDLDIVRIDGSHGLIVHPPAVAELASVLQARLDAV